MKKLLPILLVLMMLCSTALKCLRKAMTAAK